MDLLSIWNVHISYSLIFYSWNRKIQHLSAQENPCLGSHTSGSIAFWKQTYASLIKSWTLSECKIQSIQNTDFDNADSKSVTAVLTAPPNKQNFLIVLIKDTSAYVMEYLVFSNG